MFGRVDDVSADRLSRLLSPEHLAALVGDEQLLKDKEGVLLRVARGSVARFQAGTGAISPALSDLHPGAAVGEHEDVLIVLEAGTLSMLEAGLEQGETLDECLHAWMESALERREDSDGGDPGVMGRA